MPAQKTAILRAAESGCFRCCLIRDGIDRYLLAAGLELDDYKIYDHVRVTSNANSMGIRLNPEPKNDDVDSVDLGFHVVYLDKNRRGRSPARVTASNVPPVFEASWITSFPWKPEFTKRRPLLEAVYGTICSRFPISLVSVAKLKHCDMIKNMHGGAIDGCNHLTKSPYASIFRATASPEVFERIRDWILACILWHGSCKEPTNARLPTRVLDIRDKKAADHVRLRETNQERGMYVCLSHCWGDAQPLRTTTSNIEAHKSSIPWSALPKTFQDAILITRKMGVRYLWIDSLCIVQDSEEDWRRESANMAMIYGQAFFTIAALGAKDDTEGCFSEPLPGYEVHTLSKAYYRGKGCSISVGREREHASFHRDEGWEQDHKTGMFPLLGRAWFYQERLLSSRVLYLGKVDFYWECNESHTCGCRPYEYHTSAKSRTLGTLSRTADLVTGWHETVEAYTRLELTFDKDIFPALSGMARFVRQPGRSRYLAGGWEDSLVADLNWEVRTAGGRGCKRPELWRAPTWAWASVKGAVKFDSPSGNEVRCEIVQVECTSKGPDAAGELASGWLVAAGRLVPVRLSYRGSSHLVSLEAEEAGPLPRTFLKFEPDYDFTETGDNCIPSGEVLHCLHITAYAGYDISTNRFLVLRCVHEESKLFERIGIATSYNPGPARLPRSWDTTVIRII